MILDLLRQTAAADIVLVATIVTMLLSTLSKLADYADTTSTALTRATLHSTLIVVALVILVVSAMLQSKAPVDRTVPVTLSIVGFLLVTTGAFVGGDIIYLLKNIVSHHAFRGANTKWIQLDTGESTNLAALPKATPTKMQAGINNLVVVRTNDTVQTLHTICTHANKPLDKKTIVDNCVEYPWHGSRFRLSDKLVQQNPSVYNQPSYEIHPAEGNRYEVRRREVT